MTQPRAWTVGLETVQTVVDAALASGAGLDVQYLVSPTTSLEACEAKSRSFQQMFNSLRAKTRRQTMLNKGMEPKGIGPNGMLARDLTVKGPYDGLHCSRVPLPNGAGWMVSLSTQLELLDDMHIIDRASGLPLETMGAGKNERTRIVEKLLFNTANFTRADYDRGTELDPNCWNYPEWGGMQSYERMVAMNTPGVKDAGPRLIHDSGKLDLADDDL